MIGKARKDGTIERVAVDKPSIDDYAQQCINIAESIKIKYRHNGGTIYPDEVAAIYRAYGQTL